MGDLTKSVIDVFLGLSERQRQHGADSIVRALAALNANNHIAVTITRSPDTEAQWDFGHANEMDLEAFEYTITATAVKDGRLRTAEVYLCGCWEDAAVPDWYMGGYLPQKVREVLNDFITCYEPEKPHV